MFADVIGHKDVIQNLKNAIRSDRVANAYIFSGPSDIGKEFVAINFAKMLNCASNSDDACDKCISCRKIDGGNHPDVRLIKPEGQRIKIEQMRFLQRQGSYRAIEGKCKLYIISDSDKMTPEAANSLLKTLEEPPGFMVLILIASAYNALLPTIRSRCQLIRFALVPQNIIEQGLAERLSAKEPKAKWAAMQSQGKVGKAINLIRSDKINDYDVFPLLSILTQGDEKSLVHIFKKAEELSKYEDSLDDLISYYRDIMLIKQGCSDDLLSHSDPDLKKIAMAYSDAQIEKLVRLTLRTRNFIQRNINPVLAYEVMMLHSFNITSSRQ